MGHSKAVDRVFFHELGHFLAREINCRFYDGTKVKAIRIFPCGNEDDFCGAIDVELPPDFDGISRPPPKERLAQNLGGTVYGCFLQAYMTGVELQTVKENNGQDDAHKRISFLYYHKFKEYEDKFSDIETDYFKQMCECESLKHLRDINPSSYLISTENGYYVDVQKLRNEFHKTIDEHHKCYADLIDRYSELIYQ